MRANVWRALLVVCLAFWAAVITLIFKGPSAFELSGTFAAVLVLVVVASIGKGLQLHWRARAIKSRAAK